MGAALKKKNFSFPRHRELVKVRKMKHHIYMSYIPIESLFFYLQQMYLIEVVTAGKQLTDTPAHDLKFKNTITVKKHRTHLIQVFTR
jgi:hypothetical protein